MIKIITNKIKIKQKYNKNNNKKNKNKILSQQIFQIVLNIIVIVVGAVNMLKDCPKPEKIYSQQFFGHVESLLSV